jgi:hypothetical protein
MHFERVFAIGLRLVPRKECEGRRSRALYGRNRDFEPDAHSA